MGGVLLQYWQLGGDPNHPTNHFWDILKAPEDSSTNIFLKQQQDQKFGCGKKLQETKY